MQHSIFSKIVSNSNMATVIMSLALSLFSANTLAAQNVYVRCTINGTTIDGESTLVSMDRDGTVEVHGLSQGVSRQLDLAGRIVAETRFEPIRIIKKVDSSSVHFVNAMLNQQVTDCVFRFFRPSAAGDGTEEQYYTVETANGRVASISQHLPNRLVQAVATQPLSEIIAIEFQDITWTYEIGGTSFSASTTRPDA